MNLLRHQERLVLPCRDFCVEFLDNCGNTLPGDLRDRIRCDVFKTEADGPGACISKPGEAWQIYNDSFTTVVRF